MRLIAPLLFILIGIVTSAVVGALFSGRGARFQMAAIAGAIGALAGLWLRDAFDMNFGGPLPGAMLAALAGSLVTSVAIHLIASILNRKKP
ncbi:MAG: hypothetical protein V3U76_17290 [Granulosicoccus sp.]